MVETVVSVWSESLSSNRLRNNLENSWASCWVVVSIPSEVISDVGLTQLEKKVSLKITFGKWNIEDTFF
jgi:hypothetical protein